MCFTKKKGMFFMNELKVFQNSEFGELGVMMIDGKEYFPATQCAKILGYADPFKAVKQHCDEEGWVNRPVLTNGGSQNVKFITEGNLYRLIVRSKLPAAKRFERWVYCRITMINMSGNCIRNSIYCPCHVRTTSAAESLRN